jgi:hypothetical protein
MSLCSGVNIGCVQFVDNIIERESVLTSPTGASHEIAWQIGL